MLLLSRKLNEAIVIDGNIEIIITEISSDRVRIGINAPKEIQIMRKELLLIQDENTKAAGNDSLPAEFINILG